MATLHHICDECGSDFTLKYDEEQTESDPQNCPFCGEMLIDTDDINEDEDE